tara:strand:- start:2455 stop:3912 length:1458 start_codon:yes stop_codon:yes gene_type:complete
MHLPIIILYIFLSIISANPNVENSVKIPIYKVENNKYISIHDYGNMNNNQIVFYDDKSKVELKSGKHRIIFTYNASFFKINDDIYHMFIPTIHQNDDFLIPIIPFLNIINNIMSAPIGFIDTSEKYLITYGNNYNISNIEISKKSNGTIIQINTNKNFDTNIISGSITPGGWLNLTIPGGRVDSIATVNSKKISPISRIRCLQYNESAQISFLLNEKVDEFDINSEDSSIKISIRMNTQESIQKIKEMQEKWLLDTIIIDAGHGGKDPGAIGIGGLQEKTVTLDVAKKLGKLLEENLGVTVVYTRKTDKFVPLKKRTQIANDSNGKLFISIHANASKHSHSATGFETYLLRPGKWDDAVEIVQRENEVIKLEDDWQNKYTDFSDENFILASMAQNEFIKESEFLASEIQTQLDYVLNIKNRGVKQAGFYVLYGANMPNVLIELGFISNKKDVRLLNKSRYRQKMAEAIFRAIVKFKEKYENPIKQ